MLLIDLQYFPPIDFYKILSKCSNVKINLYDPYRKQGFQNRTRIASASGRLWLTVPLEGGRDQRKAIGDILISNKTAWQLQHWRALCSCYNRSPWFSHYEPGLTALFTTPFERLADWNLACLNWVKQQLELNQPLIVVEKYQEDTQDVNYQDWRHKLTPKTLEQEFPDFRRYSQVFEERIGFIPHLSILDLLFCEGKQSLEYLQSMK
ncbi:MAG: WbqC family protein [Chitinophagaceae bacterium]